MSVSDAQYLDWLQKDYARRVVLVEAEYHDGVSVKTVYFANTVFISSPTSTPANIPYEDLLEEVPRISNSIAEVFGGASKPAIGDVVIDNSSGERDTWLGYSWTGYPIRLYLGDVSWDRNDFRLIMDGVIADIQAKSSSQITYKIRDKQDLLNKQAQSTLYTTGPAKGKPIPLCYGEAYKISPVHIDTTLHKYQIHDGQIDSILAVYQDGVPKAYVANLAAGTFTLTTEATGKITCDVKGAAPSGVWLFKVADVAKDLALRSGITLPEIDTASVASMNTLCPQKVGLYVDERENILNLYDFLFQSVGGFYGFGRAGLLQFGRFAAPTGVATISLAPDDIEADGVDVKTILQPTKTVRLGYRKHWTDMGSDLSAFVSSTNRADWAQEYRVVSSVNSVSQWPLALEPDVVETALIDEAEAQDECDRKAALNAVGRKILKIRAFTASQIIECGDEVEITWNRYGLSGGANGIVTSLSESPTSFRMDLEIWL